MMPKNKSNRSVLTNYFIPSKRRVENRRNSNARMNNLLILWSFLPQHFLLLPHHYVYFKTSHREDWDS